MCEELTNHHEKTTMNETSTAPARYTDRKDELDKHPHIPLP